MGCNCGKPKCDGHCNASPAVLQITRNEKERGLARYIHYAHNGYQVLATPNKMEPTPAPFCAKIKMLLFKSDINNQRLPHHAWKRNINRRIWNQALRRFFVLKCNQRRCVAICDGIIRLRY